MNKIFVPAALLLCIEASPLLAAGVGIGSDTSSDKPSEAAPAAYESARIKTLTTFIAALTEEDRQKRADALLEVIKYDPTRAELPLFYLSQTVKSAEEARRCAPEIFVLAAKYPDDIVIAANCAGIGVLAETPASELAGYLYKTLDAYRKSDPEKRRVPTLYAVFAQYLQLLLRDGDLSTGCELLQAYLSSERQSAPPPIFLLTAADFCRNAAFRTAIGAADAPGAAELEKTLLERIAGENFCNHPENVRQLSLFYRRRHNNPAAMAAVRSFLQKQPNHPAAQLLMLQTACAAGDVGEVEKLLKLPPVKAQIDAPLARFDAQLRSGDFAAAEKTLNTIADPKLRADLKLSLLLEKRDWQAVVSHLDSHKTIDPTLLIGAAEQLRRPDLLERACSAAGEEAWENAEMANAVGYVSAVLDLDLDRAEKLVKRALEAAPDNFAYLDSMAWVKFKQGKPDEAAEWMDKALRHADAFAGSGVVLEHAGDIALARKLPEKAIRYYRLALEQKEFDRELDPDAVAEKLSKLEKTR